MPLTIGREQARLRAIFRRAILAVAACGAAAGAACATKNADAPVSGAGAGGPDGSTGEPTDGGPGIDARRPDDPCGAYVYTPDPPDTCGDYVKFPCGLPPEIVPRNDCYFNLTDCASMCPDIHYNCHAVDSYCQDAGVEAGLAIVPDEAGAVAIDCSICPNGVGRAPAGLAPLAGGAACATSALAGYFTRSAHLEAASVIAFRRLGAELLAFGAPGELVRAARDAERDEVRHTRVAARLARRFGGRYAKPVVADPGARSLEAIALENAVEGCVNEGFGALVATWQAARARDPEIARALAGIVEDETRHAALSWSVFRWSLGELSGEARARVASACVEALASLADEATGAAPVARSLRSAAGAPSGAERAALARAYAASIAEDLAA